ncbi:MAG: hypothetical protein HQ582_04635 [Planctomycetes bacterium]|nr:hypothetical protein [Planctomycetota bacterium]
MRPPLVWRVVWCPVILGLLLGCEGPSGQGSAEKRAAASASSEPNESDRPEMVDPGELPKLGDYLPPLDKGRIEVAVPEGWYVPPANTKKYVVRFQESPTERYPSVVVTAEDYEGEGISTVTRTNVRTFADQIASALKKEKSAVQPFEVGRFVGVAYRKRGRESQSVSKIIELFYLDTVVAGRKYSVHLRSSGGSLEEGQPYLYAVVAGIKFAELESSAQPEKKEVKEEAPEEPGKGEGPHEEKKAEEQAGEKPAEKAEKKPKKTGDGELDLDKLDELLKKQ